MHVPLPPAPFGFIHVPAGRFLQGFDGDEDVRLGFFNAPPFFEPAMKRMEEFFAKYLR